MLIAMAVHSTKGNGRLEFTKRAVASVLDTVDLEKHRFIVCDDASSTETREYLCTLPDSVGTIFSADHVGTAAVINKAWKQRGAGQHCVKIDDDVVIYQEGWVDWMEDTFARDPTIGICGLKRKDLEERPWHDNPYYKSVVRMLPQEKGERWLVVEEVTHVIGTCQAYSSDLLDKMGYLYQPGKYGFDDSIASVRAQALGYKRVFLHGFEIDHIDPGGSNIYTEWKQLEERKHMTPFWYMRQDILDGKFPTYYDGKEFQWHS